MFFKKQKIISKLKFTAGFTLVELLVTITIFSILTGVVFFNQQKFNSSILLTNLAYDTALTIRQAQTYGINIREFNTGSDSRAIPYGVHFSTSSRQSFILFADLDYDKFMNNPGDGLYPNGANLANCSASDGCVSRYNITRGNYIKDICAGEVPKYENSCIDKLNNPILSLGDLSISYKRPNPNAIIRYAGMTAGSDLNVATIILAGADGESFRKVRVWESGLIEIVN